MKSDQLAFLGELGGGRVAGPGARLGGGGARPGQVMRAERSCCEGSPAGAPVLGSL